VGEDGRLLWIMDAFTTADSYPYSSHYPLEGASLNYIRNSVKVVIDAYNGTTHFYVFDDEDPMIGAYRATFPSLFRTHSWHPLPIPGKTAISSSAARQTGIHSKKAKRSIR